MTISEMLQMEMQTEKTSDYICNVGERIELDVTVNKINILEPGDGTNFYRHGIYPMTRLHIMRDSDGRRVVWFAKCDSKMTVGNSYRIRATIKDHTTYQDIEQTVLARAKVLKELKPGRESEENPDPPPDPRDLRFDMIKREVVGPHAIGDWECWKKYGKTCVEVFISLVDRIIPEVREGYKADED